MISFIIPAYNEETLLGRTLEAINSAAQGLGEAFEVVVVDDASTDRTAEIAREHGAKVVSVAHRQIAAARNAGAQAADGTMFIFVDADTIVSKSAVVSAVEAMRRGAAGGGSAVRFDEPLPMYGRILAAALVPVYRAFGLASGCFLFCTRNAYHAAGGFDQEFFGGEEVVLSRALRRHGRFVFVRPFVTTSGRKLRAYSAVEIVGLMLRLAFSGPNAVRKREGLDLWYGERRHDPHSTR